MEYTSLEFKNDKALWRKFQSDSNTDGTEFYFLFYIFEHVFILLLKIFYNIQNIYKKIVISRTFVMPLAIYC